MVTRSRLRWTLRIGGGVGCYIVFMLWLRWCPQVTGVVVDEESGAAIPGAEIVRVGEGPFLISFEATVHYMSWPRLVHTDANGRFSIPPTVSSQVDPYTLVPFGWVNSVALYVYTKDHIPGVMTGAVWPEYRSPEAPHVNSDGWEVARRGEATFKRRHRWFRGYEYRIELKRAVTEEDWIHKCDCTLGIHDLHLYSEIGEEWIFSDVITYLEQWPEGKKAKDFYGEAWKAISYESCRYLRADFASGQISRQTLQVRHYRSQRLLRLSEAFQGPSERGAESPYMRSVQDLREFMTCSEDILREQNARAGGIGR